MADRKSRIIARMAATGMGVVIAGSAFAAFGATAANAATCSGAGCDGKDPVVTGCAASASVVDSASTSKGTFRLYYSATCGTNWVQVPSYAGGSTRNDGKLELAVTDVQRGVFVRFKASSSAGLHYGNMVYSPGSNCARGYGDWNGGSTWDVSLASSTC